MHFEFHLVCPKRQAIGCRQRKRCPAQLFGVNPQQQMVHHRVADQNTFNDLRTVNQCLGCDLPDQRVDCFAYSLGHLSMAAGIHHGIRNTRHQVFAKADLRVHQTRRGFDVTGRKIAKMTGNRGRAHIKGNAIDRPVIIPRPDLNDAPVRASPTGVNRNRDLPFALAKCRLQHLQRAQITDDVGKLPLVPQRFQQTFQIALRIVHVWLSDFDIIKPRRWIHDDLASLCPFADDLFVNL